MHVRRKWRGGRCRQSTRKDADGEVVEERELDRDPGRVRPRQSASATAIWDHRRSSRSQSTTCRSGERAIQLGGRSSIGSTDCSSCLRLINANEPHGRCQISRRRLRQAANRQRLNRLQRSPRLSPRVTPLDGEDSGFVDVASTKPSAFTEGDGDADRHVRPRDVASTKPSAFTEGDSIAAGVNVYEILVLQRSPRLSPRVTAPPTASGTLPPGLQRSPRLSPRVTNRLRTSPTRPSSFNEALGFHRG